MEWDSGKLWPLHSDPLGWYLGSDPQKLCVLVIHWCITTYPDLAVPNNKQLTVSRGQRFTSGYAGQFWLKVWRVVAVIWRLDWGRRTYFQGGSLPRCWLLVFPRGESSEDVMTGFPQGEQSKRELGRRGSVFHPNLGSIFHHLHHILLTRFESLSLVQTKRGGELCSAFWKEDFPRIVHTILHHHTV